MQIDLKINGTGIRRYRVIRIEDGKDLVNTYLVKSGKEVIGEVQHNYMDDAETLAIKVLQFVLERRKNEGKI